MTATTRRAGRPSVAGAARQAIVVAADALFYERGVESVSIDDIAQHAGVTRRTLYYHFSGKDQLVVEHVRLRDRVIKEAAKEATVLDAFTALERLFCAREYKGCPITNVIYSSGKTPAIVGKMTQRHKDEMQAWFVAQAAAMRARRPEIVGRQLMLLYEGAVAMARMRRDRAIPGLAREAAVTLLRNSGADV